MSGARAKLPRQARLCGAAHFTGGFAARRQGVYFTLLFRNNPANDPPRLGIIVGRHAVPGAVARTQMKRTIREVFRRLRGDLGNVDVVVKVRRRADRQHIAEARRELEKLLGRNR